MPNKKKKGVKVYTSALLLTGALALSSCGYVENSDAITFNEIVTEYADDTTVDEAFVNDTVFLDNIKRLERDLEVYRITKNFEKKELVVGQLDKEEKDYLDSLTVEEVTDLLEKYNSTNNLNPKYYQKLLYLKNSSRDFISESGLGLTESLLIKTIKAKTCEALDLDINDYSRIQIAEYHYSSVPKGSAITDYNGEIYLTSDAGQLTQYINDLYQIQTHLTYIRNGEIPVSLNTVINDINTGLGDANSLSLYDMKEKHGYISSKLSGENKKKLKKVDDK